MIAATFYFIFLLVILGYSIVIIRWSLAWVVYENKVTPDRVNKEVNVSVIVAARNEAENILNCLTALARQEFTSGMLEVIISDDLSDDETVRLVNEFISHADQKISYKLITASPDSASGKKAALLRGIETATGELILTTDADCVMHHHWVKSVASCYRNTGASMITGFVSLQPLRSVIEMMQALEFLSLSGTGAVSVILQKPLMCNGANLAFSKEAFLKSGGYDYGSQNASGDDTFLMLRLALVKPGNVVFNKDPQAIINSLPVPDFSSFVQQRLRWASKVRNYQEGYIRRTGVFIFSVNAILIFSLIAIMIRFFNWQVVLLLWIIKLLADFIFLFLVSGYAGRRRLLLLFLTTAAIYPFYIVTGMLLTLSKREYSWKERKYNPV